MNETTYYSWAIGILATIILMFVGYYLYESRKKTELKNENAKLKEQINELQTKTTNLEIEKAESQRIILNQQKQITILSHDVPPASASSERKPDDYRQKNKNITIGRVFNPHDPDLDKIK